MRQCQMRHPFWSSATQDPCLLGVGHGLEEAYDDFLRDSMPEDWKGLIAQLAERVDAAERETED
ncbi:hypothetical protein BHAOGJBA_5932 [Methylobacterium hispanicum]|uniref:Anti-sigma factor NepR domain-containing protein n=1 Tax=Methylobacterium hispanicum TaxID=270350 RepID=A0AAV4ZVV9_9HYPH|nr:MULTISPECIES: hypothetical protein [Methylobacterium]GJD92378.1 hypothetical protein BHAOGJBA_5932 [Methylobacterium hispanicum]